MCVDSVLYAQCVWWSLVVGSGDACRSSVHQAATARVVRRRSTCLRRLRSPNTKHRRRGAWPATGGAALAVESVLHKACSRRCQLVVAPPPTEGLVTGQQGTMLYVKARCVGYDRCALPSVASRGHRMQLTQQRIRWAMQSVAMLLHQAVRATEKQHAHARLPPLGIKHHTCYLGSV